MKAFLHVAQKKIILSLFFFLGLFSLSFTPIIASDRLASCSSLSFKNFLAKYSESKKMQMEHTKYPLTIVRRQGLGITIEPLEMQGSLSKQLAVAPFYPNKSQRKKGKLDSIRIKNKGKNKKLVSVAQDSTDNQMDFLFAKESNQCWTLRKIVYNSY